MENKEKIIKNFYEVVNMTSHELKEWLKTEKSINSGWKKDFSEETVGHQSGRKIVKILEKNSNKNPELYSDEDLQHMRKVVSYCRRHLAREKKIAEKDEESNAYKSLKNWGHDARKV